MVDPLALDGDASEPVVELNTPGSGAPAGQKPSVPATQTPHPVRQRLLDRIEGARQRATEGGPAVENPGPSSSPRQVAPPAEPFGAFGGLSEELERIARAPTNSGRRAPLRLGDAPLSANTVALFGIVFGLAALASVFAALSHWAPRGSASLPAESATVAPAATAPSPGAAPNPSASPSARAPAAATRKKLAGPWRIGDDDKPGYRRIEGKVGDQPFLKSVSAAGLDLKQAYRILAALKGEKDLDHCGQSDRFIALVDKSSGRLSAFEYVVSNEEIYQIKEDEGGVLRGGRLDLKVERVRARGALVMGDSFQDSAAQAGFEPTLGSALNKALEGHAAVEQFQRGDRLRIIAQEVTVLGEFARYAGIEAVEYLPAGGNDAVRVYYFQGQQSKGYVNGNGELLSESGWRRPVKNAPITSRFNPKRFHPVLKVIKPHTGTDFGAPTGTPVHAALYGTVTHVGPLGPNGNFVGLKHANGYETGYSHLSRFADGLQVGDRVKTLQVIGYVGTTGRSTGPHLHFSVKKNGTFIDGETLHLDKLVRLPGKDRDAFAVLKRSYDELLDAIPLPALPARLAEADLKQAPAAAPSAESDDEAGEASPPAAVVAAAAPAAPAPAAAPTPAAVPPRAPATTHKGYSSIYLSDRELLANQPAVHAGESEP